VDTSLCLRRLGRGRWIVALLAVVLASGPTVEAQRRGRKRAADEAKAAQASPGRPSPAVRLATPPKVAPPARQLPVQRTPEETVVLWERAVSALSAAYAERHPDRFLAAERGALDSIGLGTFGSPAALRWRAALTGALAELGRLGEGKNSAGFESLRRRLADWVQLELLLLEAQEASTSSPAGYLLRAASTLRAASEALWMRPEQRQRETAEIVAALPAYLRDARVSLVSPPPSEIDWALLALDDLHEALANLTPEPGDSIPPNGRAAGGENRAVQALERVRTWLVDERESAGGSTARLASGQWSRAVRLATGTPWEVGVLKMRALRELARLELGAGDPSRERPRRPAAEDLTRQVGSAAEHAARLGFATHILRDSLMRTTLELRTAVSPRTALEELRLAPAPDGGWVGTLLLPHPSWTPARIAARQATLRLEHGVALGVRYGLAGEAGWAQLARGETRVPSMLLDDRLVRAGLGLYALEWTRRVEAGSNPFHANDEIERACARQRAREAARLLATIELHVEGVSEHEAAASFRRRTGVDEETAAAEACAALRDPLHGLAYLGLIEILALEERLAGRFEVHRVARLVWLALARNPGLRPSDLSAAAVLAAAGASEEKPDERLEIPTPAQQELPRSR
jgi:hypothetical protein